MIVKIAQVGARRTETARNGAKRAALSRDGARRALSWRRAHLCGAPARNETRRVANRAPRVANKAIGSDGTAMGPAGAHAGPKTGKANLNINYIPTSSNLNSFCP